MLKARHAGTLRFRFFASPVDVPRARRATDVLLAASTLLALVLVGWINQPPAAVEAALIDLLATLSRFFDGLWQLLYDLLLLWAAVLVLVAAIRRRWSLVRDQVLAALLALAIGVLAGWVVEEAWPGVWSVLSISEPPPLFPSLRLAVASASIVTASPYLSRPVRRAGRWFLGLGAGAVALLGLASPTGAVAGLLTAALAAAVVHLVFGSCGGRPGLKQVQASLADLGVPVASLGAADRQPAGAFLVQATADDGRALTVKVYGRDAYDTQLLAKLWRTVWYREEGPAPTLSRLQQAEHEAFVTLLAQQAGVPVQEIVTAGVTEEDDALLVMQLRGESLRDLPAVEVTDDVLRSLWEAVGQLHRRGIAHGQIDPSYVRVARERVTLVDLSGAAVAPDEEQRRTDQAQTLVSSAVVAGVERGLAVASEALGPEELAQVVPYLQMPALSRGLRPQVRRAGIDLDDLRRRTADAADAPPADLQQLRRVTWGSVLQTGVMLLAFSALITGLSGLDLEDLTSELGDARVGWLVFGALLVQAPRLAQAVSTLGASPRPLPLGPVYALQLAVSYINLAVPSAAARIAVNVRFFQRQGVPPGSSLAVGAVDGFSGFVVQTLLLGSLLVFTNATLDLDLEMPSSGGPARLLLGLVVLVVLAVGTLLAVPRWKKAVLTRAAELLGDAWDVVRGLRSARRLAMLLGGNLVAEVLFAASLGAFAQALGYDVGFGELLLINISTALLAGLVPVPGGIGVTEAALTVGLTAAGLPQGTAFAVAILYRLASFYVPPIWGWFAFRWLQANKYL